MNRRNFLRLIVGGIAAGAAARTFPFRVYSFPVEIHVPTARRLTGWMYLKRDCYSKGFYFKVEPLYDFFKVQPLYDICSLSEPARLKVSLFNVPQRTGREWQALMQESQE
jgi:hypothetical protein